MAYTSPCLTPSMPIIDDNNYQSFINPTVDGEVKLCGTLPRDFSADPFGQGPYLAPFPDSMRIPVKDWPDLIREKDSKKSWITNLSDQVGSKVLDQDGTNFCWANGVVRALTIARVYAGEPQVMLSPASVAAPINNYRNNGGWGSNAVKFIAQNGCVPVDRWPANYWQSSKYATPENLQIAKRYRIDQWWDLRPGDTEALGSMVLQDFACPAGLSWWSHEICFTFLAVAPDGSILFGFDNSWGAGWGQNGRGTMTERKARADDCQAVKAPTPSIAA